MKSFLPFLFIFAACTATRITVNNQQYIAKYNASVQADRMYTNMAINRSYNASATDYISVANQITYFTTIDSARSAKMYRQDTALFNSWLEKWNTHRSKTPTPSQVGVNQKYTHDQFEIVLQSEKNVH